MSEPLHYASITDLSARLRDGHTTARELTELMLDRIARYDPVLHAYAHVTADHARAQADLADAQTRNGQWRSPLHGIPIGVKDIFLTPGLPTSVGTTLYDRDRPTSASTVTARLEAAGAIILGKHVCTEGIYIDYHPTVTEPINPWGRAYWTGNSSSGSGVALCAGLAYGSIGSDTGGSIRLPSACCGVVGIKPTWGRVSRHGVYPLAESLDHVGPMARTVADAAILLGIIAGADPRDPTCAITPVPNYLARLDAGISGLRIGHDVAYVARHASAEIIATIEAAIVVMQALGAEIVPVTMPEVTAVLEAWAVQTAAEAAAAHAATYPSRADAYGPVLSRLIERGHATGPAALAHAHATRTTFTSSMERLFTDIDVMILPALPVGGPSLDFMGNLGEDPAGAMRIGPFTAPFNMCGFPTITLPCGQTEAGIPIGLQFAAAPFGEIDLVHAAHAFEQQSNVHHRRPFLPTPSEMDMAKMDVQKPQAPQTDAERRARFFNSGNAFNIILPPIPGQIFTAPAHAALACRRTGFHDCDIADTLEANGPATTPLMLARYAGVRPGMPLSATLPNTSSIWYVIKGSADFAQGSEHISLSAGDILLVPGRRRFTMTAQTPSAFWLVGNDPFLRHERVLPDPEQSARLVHYPRAEIARQLGRVYAATRNSETSGHALIFSNVDFESTRNISPSLTLSLNTLRPGSSQAPHRHNAAAITLVISGNPAYTMLGDQRCDWQPWATMITPAAMRHSHHNDGYSRAEFLIVQDGGLYYQARTMGFSDDS